MYYFLFCVILCSILGKSADALTNCSFVAESGEYFDLSPFVDSTGRGYTFSARGIGAAKWNVNVCSPLVSKCDRNAVACADQWATDSFNPESFGYISHQHMSKYSKGEGVTIHYTGDICPSKAGRAHTVVDFICDYSQIGVVAEMISTLEDSNRHCFAHFQLKSEFACAAEPGIVRNQDYNPMCSLILTENKPLVDEQSGDEYIRSFEAFLMPLRSAIPATARSGMVMSGLIDGGSTAAIYVNSASAVEVIIASTSAKISYFTSPNTLIMESWSHIAVVLNASVPELFIGGVAIPFTRKSPCYAALNYTDRFSLGDHSRMSNSFYGYITKVNTWSRPLAPSEVKEHSICFDTCNRDDLLHSFEFNECGGRYFNSTGTLESSLLCGGNCIAHNIWPVTRRVTCL